jgi:hypothetical protein
MSLSPITPVIYVVQINDDDIPIATSIPLTNNTGSITESSNMNSLKSESVENNIKLQEITSNTKTKKKKKIRYFTFEIKK